MDTAEEKIPLSAEEALVKNSGGISADPIDVTRKAVAENLGNTVEEITPNTEIANTEIGNFLKDVVHVYGKDEVVQVGVHDSTSNSGLNELGQNLRALTPIGGGSDEELVREIPSTEANKFELERLEKMKAA